MLRTSIFAYEQFIAHSLSYVTPSSPHRGMWTLGQAHPVLFDSIFNIHVEPKHNILRYTQKSNTGFLH